MNRIYSKKVLRDFWTADPDAEDSLRRWYETVKQASWDNPVDVKKDFRRISILKNGRIVFRIKGNHYRIVVRINYKENWVFVRFVGSHKDYNKIDATSI